VVIVMSSGTAADAIERVTAEVERMGCKAHRKTGEFRTVIAALGEPDSLDPSHLASLEGVESVIPIMKPFKLASREFHEGDSVVVFGGGQVPRVKVGGKHLICIAGPGFVENEDALYKTAATARTAGATVLRGAAFRRSDTPYSHRSHGEQALRWLRGCGNKLAMPVCADVSDARQVPLVERYADAFLVGPLDTQNIDLLQEIGKARKPVVLKRAPSATVQEWLLSAEYVLGQGNHDVILCESGIKTFEDSVRYSIDVSSVPVIRNWSHLPVIIDPSYATGRREWVPASAAAGIAAGAHGVLVEVHHRPQESQSEGPQALLPDSLAALNETLRTLAAILGKEFS
jgi:3-deoxy-7-phosphoheptulonate synthase